MKTLDAEDDLLYKACAVISDHRMRREDREGFKVKTTEPERRANLDAFLDSLGDEP